MQPKVMRRRVWVPQPLAAIASTMSTTDDPLVSVIPVHFTTTLAANVHLHQFPLLTRPLQVPPAVAQSGKKIRARTKRKAGRLELHIPIDTRVEVWNKERSRDLGQARAEDDQEKSGAQSTKGKQENEEARLSELRLRSEQVPSRCAYVLGIVRDRTCVSMPKFATLMIYYRKDKLHLHPVSEVHQFRPTLTYMDMYMRKSTRRNAGHGSDSDSDDGPPPDPDEPPPVPTAKREKQSRKTNEDAKEVHVSMKRTDDKGVGAQGGLSTVRREMLVALRDEDEELWQDVLFNDGEVSRYLRSGR